MTQLSFFALCAMDTVVLLVMCAVVIYTAAFLTNCL